MIRLDGKPVVGFGNEPVTVPTNAIPSPWAVALVTSVVSAATGWVIEEVSHRARKKRQ